MAPPHARGKEAPSLPGACARVQCGSLPKFTQPVCGKSPSQGNQVFTLPFKHKVPQGSHRADKDSSGKQAGLEGRGQHGLAIPKECGGAGEVPQGLPVSQGGTGCHTLPDGSEEEHVRRSVAKKQKQTPKPVQAPWPASPCTRNPGGRRGL